MVPFISFVFVGKQKLSVSKEKGLEMPHGVSAMEVFPGFLLKWELASVSFFLGGRSGNILFLVFYT